MMTIGQPIQEASLRTAHPIPLQQSSQLSEEFFGGDNLRSMYDNAACIV